MDGKEKRPQEARFICKEDTQEEEYQDAVKRVEDNICQVVNKRVAPGDKVIKRAEQRQRTVPEIKRMEQLRIPDYGRDIVRDKRPGEGIGID